MKLSKAFTITTFCLALVFTACQTEPQSNTTIPQASTATAEKGGTIGLKGRLSPSDFDMKLQSSDAAQLIDLRTPQEVKTGGLEGAANINYHADDFETQLDKLNKDQPVFLYCQGGVRSTKTYIKMEQKGFKQLYELEGGYLAWKKYKE